MHQFRTDPKCRVLIGTTSIERSVNLQAARHMIAVDTIANPARMTQIAGRVARDGSRHSTVYFHQLLHRGTQEENLLELLRREQALSDYVWGEESQIFEALTPRQLLDLVSGDPEVYRRAAA
jgi:SNF2 family DNA or RNA helicase